MSRQSVWPSAPPPSDHLNYLEDCIQATENCVSSLTSALQRLEPGIRDYPRLTRVFSNQHRYLVLPATTIQSEITSLSQNLAPQIEKLLKRADLLVEAERQKLEGMEKTIQILQSASLPPSDSDHAVIEPVDEEQEQDIWSCKIEGLEMKGLNMNQIKKVNLMRNKRERLEKERMKLEKQRMELGLV